MKPKVIPSADFSDFVIKSADFGHREWVFRGHGQLGWRIESSLARHLRAHQKNIDPSIYDVREKDAIRKFRRSAHQFLSHLPANAEQLEWLAIMQHFGAPTRLIDLTYSPHVALFFAVADAGPTISFAEKLSDTELNKRYKPYEVHALHLQSLRLHAKKVLGRTKGDPKEAEYCIGDGASQKNEFVGFFEGQRHNPRQVAQQALFLVPSKIDLDVEKTLDACPSASIRHRDSAWVVFRFPGGRKSYMDMVYSLINANLTAESLFPGLEGIARSIYQRWYQRGIGLS